MRREGSLILGPSPKKVPGVEIRFFGSLSFDLKNIFVIFSKGLVDTRELREGNFSRSSLHLTFIALGRDSFPAADAKNSCAA